MKRSKGFTLIELLVVISIIALLLSILMPSLQKVKKQAQAVVCRSNLKQLGLSTSLYAVDNNDRLTPGHGLSDPFGDKYPSLWPNALGPYYDGVEGVRVCPSAKRGNPDPQAEADFLGSTFEAMCWGGPLWGRDDEWIEHGQWLSYSKNNYASDAEDVGGGLTPELFPVADYWKTANAPSASRAPLMGDSAWILGGADDDHPALGVQFIQPASYEDLLPENWGIELYAINRHSKSINMVFLDYSARRIDLKELWTLKWHRNFNTRNIWTVAGGATQAQWQLTAPWMAGLKDY